MNEKFKYFMNKFIEKENKNERMEEINRKV